MLLGPSHAYCKIPGTQAYPPNITPYVLVHIQYPPPSSGPRTCQMPGSSLCKSILFQPLHCTLNTALKSGSSNSAFESSPTYLTSSMGLGKAVSSSTFVIHARPSGRNFPSRLLVAGFNPFLTSPRRLASSQMLADNTRYHLHHDSSTSGSLLYR